MADRPDHNLPLPALIADDGALDRYLAEYQRNAYAMRRSHTGVDLPAWLATGAKTKG